MDSEVNRHEKEETNDRTSIRENGVTVKQSQNKKSPGKLNPKLSVFRCDFTWLCGTRPFLLDYKFGQFVRPVVELITYDLFL